MQFLRNRDDYIVEHDKKQALEELKKDDRIKSIKFLENKTIMKIITKPVISKGFKCDNIIIKPIGTYIIKLTEKNSTISVSIRRKEGGVRINARNHHHPHICTTWDGPICWGNAEADNHKIRKNKDWYWLGKQCLELVYDLEPEKENYISESLYLDVLIKLQITYNKEDKGLRKKLINEKKSIMKNHRVNRSFSDTEY